MCIQRNIIFLLARLDAAQAADALGGIDAECPLMLGPVISRYCRDRRRLGLRRLRNGRNDSSRRYGTCRRGCRATCKGASEAAEKFSPSLLLAFELFPVFHLHVLLGNCLFGQVLSTNPTYIQRWSNRSRRFPHPHRSSPSRLQPSCRCSTAALVGFDGVDQIIPGLPGKIWPGAIAGMSVGAVTGGTPRCDRLTCRCGLRIRRRRGFAFQSREISREMTGIVGAHPLSRGAHHGIVARPRTICLEHFGKICRVLSGEARAGEDLLTPSAP